MLSSTMAFSWAAYRRNIPRLPRVRLAVMAAFCAFFAVLPWLGDDPLLHRVPVALLFGLSLPPMMRRLITAAPEWTQRWLKAHAVLLGVAGYFRDAMPDAVLGTLVAGLAGAWMSIWFTLVSDDEVVAETPDAT